MATVSQLMIRKVVTIRPETTIRDAIELLITHDVSGVPVTNEAGEIVGVVSELAMFDVLFAPEIQQLPVSEVMTPDVYTVTEDELLTEAAHLFAFHGVRRLPVVSDGRLVGMLTRRDLLRYCQQQGEHLEAPSDYELTFVDGPAELRGGGPLSQSTAE